MRGWAGRERGRKGGRDEKGEVGIRDVEVNRRKAKGMGNDEAEWWEDDKA